MPLPPFPDVPNELIWPQKPHPPSCRKHYVTIPIPRCACGVNLASKATPPSYRKHYVTISIPGCACGANLAAKAMPPSYRKHYIIPGCACGANLAAKATPLPTGSITSLSPFPDVPVVLIWPQKPRPLPAGSIT